MNERLTPEIYVGLPYKERVEYRQSENIRLYISNEPEVKSIVIHTCIALNQKIDEVLSKSRKREMVCARCIIVHELLRNTYLTLAKIGKILNRDHSSIIYLRELYTDTYKTDPFLRKCINMYKTYMDALNNDNSNPYL